ncbi:MAG: hypothetical protein PHF67_00560 [Candidatus Nanoarchaeia archaeon]|nr:hypothetical protein [Candidatus Nanoarchaeia archaeon]
MNSESSDLLTEERIEHERAYGNVPMEDLKGVVRFGLWDFFCEVTGAPMPPIGYVVQPSSELEANCCKTGETCRLEPIWSKKKQKVYYAWFDENGERVSF